MAGAPEPRTLSTSGISEQTLIPTRSSTIGDLSTLPAVAGAVRLIASTIDQLPVTVTSGPVPTWLRRPRRFGSAFDMGDIMQLLVDAMVTRGAGYLRCIRVGESWRLDPVHPDSVQVTTSTSGIVSIGYRLAGAPIDKMPDSPDDAVPGGTYLLPIPYRVSSRKPQGTSPLLDAADTLHGHLATERHASFIFDNGTYTGGVLETDQDITAAGAEKYAARWTEKRAAGGVVVLGSGLRYRNEVASSTDLQWTEARAFNQASVYMMLGIPPAYMGASLVGGQSSLSYANAQDNRRLFRTSCLEAFTSQIEDAFSTLLPPGRSAEEDQRVAFDWTSWEGGDQGADNAAV